MTKQFTHNVREHLAGKLCEVSLSDKSDERIALVNEINDWFSDLMDKVEIHIQKSKDLLKMYDDLWDDDGILKHIDEVANIIGGKDQAKVINIFVDLEIFLLDKYGVRIKKKTS